MAGIFISYRRSDTEGYAGRLFEGLRARFGRDVVFFDVAGIEPGQDSIRWWERRWALAMFCWRSSVPLGQVHLTGMGSAASTIPRILFDSKQLPRSETTFLSFPASAGGSDAAAGAIA